MASLRLPSWCIRCVVAFVCIVSLFTTFYIRADEDGSGVIKSVYDTSGVRWEEYFDEDTGRSYFHNPVTDVTQWVINLPKDASISPEDDASALIDAVFKGLGSDSDESVDSSASTPGEESESVGKSSSPSSSSPVRKSGRRNGSGKKRGAKKSGAKKPGGSKKSSKTSTPRPQVPLQDFGVDPYGAPLYADPYGGGYMMIGGAGMDGMAANDPYHGAYGGWLGMDGFYGAGGLGGGDGAPGGLGGLAYIDADAFDSAMANGGGGDGAFLEGLNGLGTIEVPSDAESLHLLEDPAGRLQRFDALGGGESSDGLVRLGKDTDGADMDKYRVRTIFDDLEGIAARVDLQEPLKSPLVFHEMFLRSPGMGSGVDEVRRSLEKRIEDDDDDYESWEQLGHVWRHYGNIPRTIDCYRKALTLLPAEAHAVRSSLHINLAGLLDQLNYVNDALVVLHAFLDATDVTNYEAENNFAVGYMMVAQLELRAKRIDTAEAALAASLQLQPRLRPAVMGVQQELWERKKKGDGDGSSMGSSFSYDFDDVSFALSGGGSGSGGGGGSSSKSQSWLGGGDLNGSVVSADKDPWLLLRLLGLFLRLVDIGVLWLTRLIVELLGLLSLDFTSDRSATSSSSSSTSNIEAYFSIGQIIISSVLHLASMAPRVVVFFRKVGNAFPCVISGVTTRAIAEYGWQAHMLLRVGGSVGPLPSSGRKRGYGSNGSNDRWDTLVESASLARQRSDSMGSNASAGSADGDYSGGAPGSGKGGFFLLSGDVWKRTAYWLRGSFAVARFLILTLLSPVTSMVRILSKKLGWNHHSPTPSHHQHSSSSSKNRRTATNAEMVVYLAVPLLLGHGYSLWTEYLVVDCLVLLFVGGLLFPFIAPPPDTHLIIGPVRMRLVRGT